MEVILSAGNAGGSVQIFEEPLIIGAVFDVGDEQYRYDGDGFAVYIGKVPASE